MDNKKITKIDEERQVVPDILKNVHSGETVTLRIMI